ncbi:MAG TPA: phospholipase [Solirubrobacteraceae bacterium]
MAALEYQERPASGQAHGLLVLHHGRGADDHDLLPLADVFDPQRRLHVVTPRAPLRLPGAPGYHWYVVPQVGFPDPDTFQQSRGLLASFHDELWERTGLTPAQTIVGGFSQGTVMSYTMALSTDRPAPAGVLAMSGFIPVVEGWEPQFAGRESMRVLISHGRLDPVIPVQFGQRAREVLVAAGLSVDYREFEGGHNIDPRDLPRAIEWVASLTSG